MTPMSERRHRPRSRSTSPTVLDHSHCEIASTWGMNTSSHPTLPCHRCPSWNYIKTSMPMYSRERRPGPPRLPQHKFALRTSQ